MKKLFCLIVCIVMTVSAAICFAEGSQEPISYTYQILGDGTAEITGCENAVGDIVIPAELDGIPVTSIGFEAFDGCKEITSVVIPDSVTYVGVSAFAACTSMTYVHIPEGITTIDEQAFRACKALTTVTIPDSVVTMGENPFRFCTSLREIVVSPEHTEFESIDGVLFNKSKKELVCYPIALEADTYEIPHGVLSIGSKAFFRSEYLTTVIIPETVTRIGDHSFYWCPALAKIVLPESVTIIERYAFFDCDMLASVTIPASVVTIEDKAFEGCALLTLTVERDSYAKNYAAANGISCAYYDAEN